MLRLKVKADVLLIPSSRTHKTISCGNLQNNQRERSVGLRWPLQTINGDHCAEAAPGWYAEAGRSSLDLPHQKHMEGAVFPPESGLKSAPLKIHRSGDIQYCRENICQLAKHMEDVVAVLQHATQMTG
jgi:hypothetical protein